MTAWSGVHFVAGGKMKGMLGVMVCKLLPPDMYGVLISTLANLLRCHLRSIGQHITKTFPRGQFFGQGPDGFVGAPGHFNPIGLFLGNEPVLITFNGEGNSCPGRDGVKSVAVANIAGLDYRFQVVVETVGAKHGGRLIFRPSRTFGIIVLSGSRPHMSSASDGALIAGKFLQRPLNHSLFGERLKIWEVNDPYPSPVLDRRITTQNP